MAAGYGLANSKKPESYEICFVTDNNYVRFLKDNVPGLATRVSEGEIVFEGRPIGTHRGYPFYTVGQRKGLGVSHSQPLYVKSIGVETNTLELDTEQNLYSKTLHADRVNFVKNPKLTDGKTYTGKIRYKDSGTDCIAKQVGEDEIIVEFEKPRRAITPGQSVVLYEGEDIVAGGIITKVTN